jgi:signal transduction histidine kinase
MQFKNIRFDQKHQYHPELVSLFATNSILASFSAHIAVPILFIYVLSEYIDHTQLGVWFISSILIASMRIYSANKLTTSTDIKKKQQYLIYIYITVLLAALMWATISFMVFLYAPKIYLLFTAIIIVGISAGAITTMSMLYQAYFIFVVVSTIPLLIEFLLLKDKLSITLSILVFFFVVYILIGGYRYYKKLREAFILKDQLKHFNLSLEKQVAKRTEELAVLNNSLESKVEEEIEKNRKKDQQLVQQSRQAQMGEMISMIAHQWRQPLGAISASSIDLKMKLLLGHFDLSVEEKREECSSYFDSQLTKIESFVENLTTTIDDFRNFYKPNKEKKSMLINEPILKSLNIIRESAKAKGIEFTESYESTKDISMYDGELMQVFLNIFKNAQDNFLEKNIQNANIDIVSKDIDNGVEVYISDNGGGIPKDVIEKIFDPYFSTKNEKNGTGLGLYMSKTIVEDHHKGKLKVENIDNGVRFTITIFS